MANRYAWTVLNFDLRRIGSSSTNYTLLWDEFGKTSLSPSPPRKKRHSYVATGKIWQYRRWWLGRAQLLFIFDAHAQVIFRVFLVVARPELHSHHERRGATWKRIQNRLTFKKRRLKVSNALMSNKMEFWII